MTKESRNKPSYLNYIEKNILKSWVKFSVIVLGLLATVWFLIRVIPKPSRATYPCQRAAFPLATGFVLWLISLLTITPLLHKAKKIFPQRVWIGSILGMVILSGFMLWNITVFNGNTFADNHDVKAHYNYVPEKSNDPSGIAKGIFPGRVVWAHDPKAAKWSGNWKEKSDQWWLDKNTDQQRIDAMLKTTLTNLTGTDQLSTAWDSLFKHHNSTVRGLVNTGYRHGETVALKINVNNSEGPNKTDNYSDASPQMVLAVVRQLINEAHVPEENIIVYDVRRFIPPYILTKVWSEYKDVRFVQKEAAEEIQPKNPGYNSYHGLEAAEWIDGISYSKGEYNRARYIAKQVFDATYLINMSLLKSGSYPYQNMEIYGDEGQAGLTLSGKNHFGSIDGPYELHPIINPNDLAVKNSYSPMVDLAASPNLGKKTMLYIMDGLYSGRKWRTYPNHFPNPPFNNAVEPYENTTWPSCVLSSIDGVALDCVGLDILYSQTIKNVDSNGQSRLLIREYSQDYLLEMAQANNPPSGTKYMQEGKQLESLGVFEHWDNDLSRKYSRNLDKKNGKGIELIYLPIK
jgi:hypothetical protein